MVWKNLSIRLTLVLCILHVCRSELSWLLKCRNCLPLPLSSLNRLVTDEPWRKKGNNCLKYITLGFVLYLYFLYNYVNLSSSHAIHIGTELLPILMVFFILIDSVLDNVLILSGEVVFWSFLRANGSENLEINFQRLLNLQMFWFLLLFNQTEKSEVEFVANWLVDHSIGFKPNRNVSSKINDNATVAIFDSTTTCCYGCYCCCLNSNPGEE